MPNYIGDQVFFYESTNGQLLSSGGQSSAVDGENDDSFEVGETENIILEGTTPTLATYLGTTTVDGNEYPVFDDGNFVILFDSSPSTIATAPANLSAGDIASQNFAFCFLAGTMIATPEGERAVEALAIGDPVLTADGRSVPVRWMGRQTVFPALVSSRMLPVRITRGALNGVVSAVDGASGPVPHRDLVVTADHGMLIAGVDGDGLVINASALVNGTTIHFVEASELKQSVVYYHVETEDHDVVVAEGAPAETFIDYKARRSFDNHAEYETLYGAERIVPEMAVTRISSQRLLPEHVRARLGISEDRTAEVLLDAAFETRAA